MNIGNLGTQEFVILDTETTGLYPQLGDALVELAAQRIKGPNILSSFDHVINPGVPCKPDAAAVHKMSDDFICKNGKPLSEIMPKFVEFAKDAVLVGHNIVRFDMEFINNHLRQLGLPPLLNPVMDTVQLAREKLRLPDYHLKTLAGYYDIDYSNAHRAMRDVEITREVFWRLTGITKQNALF